MRGSHLNDPCRGGEQDDPEEAAPKVAADLPDECGVCGAPEGRPCDQKQHEAYLRAQRGAQEEADPEDPETEECHHVLTMAGVSPGSLVERIEDVIEERDAALAEAERLRSVQRS